MKSVFLSLSADIIHGGHIELIRKASELGEVTVGALTDKVVASYKKFPLLTFEERVKLYLGIKGVSKVVEQTELNPRSILLKYKPDILVHGDNWREGYLKQTRYEALEALAEYGGQLIEFPYSANKQYASLEIDNRQQLFMPYNRAKVLRNLLTVKPLITAIEAHSGLTGIIAENTKYFNNGRVSQFDAMWCSSLCDSALRGKPDIELVDMTSRLRTVEEILEVSTKPVIFDGDTGGLEEHFAYNVKTLERVGVSAVIIEDKTGLKRNSLFGTEVQQTQDSIVDFCSKIEVGKNAQKTKDFMIIARVESLIAGNGMDDALNRAFAYVEAKADGIMIHSREKEPDEIFEFLKKFRSKNTHTPIVLVPTSYHSVKEDEFEKRGANIIIYANQLMRSSFSAMKKTALSILEHERAQEADEFCIPFNEIIKLI